MNRYPNSLPSHHFLITICNAFLHLCFYRHVQCTLSRSCQETEPAQVAKFRSGKVRNRLNKALGVFQHLPGAPAAPRPTWLISTWPRKSIWSMKSCSEDKNQVLPFSRISLLCRIPLDCLRENAACKGKSCQALWFSSFETGLAEQAAGLVGENVYRQANPGLSNLLWVSESSPGSFLVKR